MRYVGKETYERKVKKSFVFKNKLKNLAQVQLGRKLQIFQGGVNIAFLFYNLQPSEKQILPAVSANVYDAIRVHDDHLMR